MYTTTNYRTKQAFKEAVAAGGDVSVYQPGGFFPRQADGVVHLEGPHYPQPHSWYAQATIRDGVVIPGTVK